MVGLNIAITRLSAWNSRPIAIPASSDPVAPAKRSGKALAKAKSHALEDSTPVHSFSTLMADLAAVVRSTCITPGARADAPTFEITTTANANQLRAFALIQAIKT